MCALITYKQSSYIATLFFKHPKNYYLLLSYKKIPRIFDDRKKS